MDVRVLMMTLHKTQDYWQIPHDCARTWRPSSCISFRSPAACCAYTAGADNASRSSNAEALRFIAFSFWPVKHQ